MKFRTVPKFVRYEYSSDTDLTGRAVETTAPVSAPPFRPDLTPPPTP